MPDSILTWAVAWAVAGLLLWAGLMIYYRQFRRILHEGGKVYAGNFDLSELLISIVLAGFFTLITVSPALGHPTKEPAVKIESVLPNSLVFVVLTAGIAGFVQYRGLDLRPTFGLSRVSFPALLGWSCGLLAAAFPMLEAANILTGFALKGNAEPQPLVDLFHMAAQNHDYRVMGTILASAVCIQPICEEFLFRGIFYGVWKRYLGPLRSGLLASLLFAAFHTSVGAFAGLFVLAVCLNIAYERTGSLLVPILMHALFNLIELIILFGVAQSGASQ